MNNTLSSACTLENVCFVPVEVSGSGHGSTDGAFSATRTLKVKPARRTFKLYKRVGETSTFKAEDGATLSAFDVRRETRLTPEERLVREENIRRLAGEAHDQDLAARRVANGYQPRGLS